MTWRNRASLLTSEGTASSSDFGSQLSSAGTVLNLPCTSPVTSSSVHTHQQILRRKKLVAQSKLSRQPRSQQHQLGQKGHDLSSGGSTPNQSPSAGMQVKLQKTPLSPAPGKPDQAQKPQPPLQPTMSQAGNASNPSARQSGKDGDAPPAAKKPVATQNVASQASSQLKKPGQPQQSTPVSQPGNGGKVQAPTSDSCQHAGGGTFLF